MVELRMPTIGQYSSKREWAQYLLIAACFYHSQPHWEQPSANTGFNLITTPLQGASNSLAALTVQHSESAPSLDDAQQRVLNEQSRPRNQVTIRYRQRWSIFCGILYSRAAQDERLFLRESEANAGNFSPRRQKNMRKLPLSWSKKKKGKFESWKALEVSKLNYRLDK